ncbi:MAG: bifunctional proline dehydrogenase/L-glutamate gamma-semialdehyde dehydrogenase PutA [Rickettsiales bacterium]
MHWLDEISAHALEDEATAVGALLRDVAPIEARDKAVRARAAALIANQRAHGPGSTVEAFLQSYGLSTREGIAMLCLAEALLRIPDAANADTLIDDTFAQGNWREHLGKSDSTLVNASAYALLLTGSVLKLDEKESLAGWFGGLIKRSGEPVIRQALRSGMKFLGTQFVMGETVADAIANARAHEKQGYCLSYDILGEGARTDTQARGYVESYLSGIRQIAAAATETELYARPGISVKLSALHARYTQTQRDRVWAELLPRLKAILRVAKECNIAVSLDAEEANRLELELEIYKDLLADPEFAGFDGIGFVLQAYQKRAVHVARALTKMATDLKRRIPVRLVKGAYWDSEIKYAQMMGLPGYPVFTRKEHTDLSYLACAQELLRAPAHIYPQFASHNALTVATILEMGGDQPFEFQRLHGMGESLHDQLVGSEGDLGPLRPANAGLTPAASGSPTATRSTSQGGLTPPSQPSAATPAASRLAPSATHATSETPHRRHRCRIYAPVGAHKDLLAYLIRRLLENGANSSFVHLLLDAATPIEALTESPIAHSRAHHGAMNPAIPLPADLYGAARKNSAGIDFGYRSLREPFMASVAAYLQKSSPAPADMAKPEATVARAVAAFPPWDKTPVAERAEALRRTADAMETHAPELIGLCITEAKKTYADAIAEIREAVDFCRYYAALAESQFAPVTLPGPTGESNVLSLHGRGAFLCISPWNFPLAIFVGQVAAALVSGNTVLAKPAEQTPRIAARAVELFHQSGVPIDALILCPGPGETVGAALAAHPDIAGICFTGSTVVAKILQRTLAAGDGPIVPLIAETGGMNAMIVDSSALLEQACDDIIVSAFGSAGQRCSGLRMLFVQEEVAQDLHDLLVGAMDELRVGDPALLSTDIGPVIDVEAQTSLQAHIKATGRMARWSHISSLHSSLAGESNSRANLVGGTPTQESPHGFASANPAPPQGGSNNYFVLPTAIGLDDAAILTTETFGPVLHVFRYKAKELPALLKRIHATGYGLTFGLHTRLRSVVEEVLEHAPMGNRYVNRSMIGAVVGVQPFGGEGLSGTGPKAGGPHYLLRFAAERSTTINTAAIGGNVELLK